MQKAMSSSRTACGCLVAVAASALLAAAAGPCVAQYPPAVVDIPELPSGRAVSITDGDLADWKASVGEPVLTVRDFFADPSVNDQRPPFSDLDFNVWIAWLSEPARVYFAIERFDNSCICNYEGAEEVWARDGVWCYVDGDNSGYDTAPGASHAWYHLDGSGAIDLDADTFVDGRLVGVRTTAIVGQGVWGKIKSTVWHCTRAKLR